MMKQQPALSTLVESPWPYPHRRPGLAVRDSARPLRDQRQDCYTPSPNSLPSTLTSNAHAAVSHKRGFGALSER